MASSQTYFDPKVLSSVGGLRVRAKHIVEGYVAGLHRSPYHGFSIEFSEHREYAAGDDLRYLDWKAYARTDKLYVKQFEDETNLIAYLAVDASESMDYRGADDLLSKFDYAATLSVCLSWLVLEQQDAASLAIFENEIQSHVRPSTGGPHLHEIVRALESSSFKKKTSLGKVLGELSQTFSRRGLVFVVSDLFDDLESLSEGLQHLRYRRHDVVLLHVVDPSELSFPFDRPMRFRGLEGISPVVADPVSLRNTYVAEFQDYLGRVESLCRSLQIEHHLISTETHFDVALRRILRQRS